MEKIVISVVGRDRPGIVAAVSRILFEHGCNIENVSQTIQQGEFAALFIASMSESFSHADLLTLLQEGLRSLDLEVLLKPLSPAEDTFSSQAATPFVLTTTGSDRLGLVAGITEVLARYHVNITTLSAVFRGGDDPARNTMIYEVDIPGEVSFIEFRQALQQRAQELGLALNLQHRAIFESIHRI